MRSSNSESRRSAVSRRSGLAAVAPRRRTPSLDNCHSATTALSPPESRIGSRRPILRSAAMRRSVFDFVRCNRRPMQFADRMPSKPPCRNSARISRSGTPSTLSVAWICTDHFNITCSRSRTGTATGTVTAIGATLVREQLEMAIFPTIQGDADRNFLRVGNRGVHLPAPWLR